MDPVYAEDIADREVHDPGHPWPEQRGFTGEIGLECGHGWPGESDSEDDARGFMAMCIATGDTVRCRACGDQVKITGPLVAKPA